MNAHRGKKSRLMPALPWALGFFTLYLTLTGLVLPHWVRPELEKRLSHSLNSTSRVQALSFNPLTLTFTASDIAVSYPGDAGSFLYLDRLEASFSFLSLFRLTPGITELKLDKPVIDLTRFADGSFSPRRFLA
jgi:uncharacterized protein involved in outer membrane biogenesis